MVFLGWISVVSVSGAKDVKQIIIDWMDEVRKLEVYIMPCYFKSIINNIFFFNEIRF